MDFKDFKNRIIKNNNGLDKIINEMFNDVKSDKDLLNYLKDIKIDSDEKIRNNIAIISAVKEDLDYCRNCPGFYNCAKRHQHYVFTFKLTNGILDKTLIPCSLKLKDDEINQSYIIRDFPMEWRDSTIVKLDKSKVRMAVLKRYKEILKSNRNWIFINGTHRSGKSYIATTLLNDLIKSKGGKGAFINYPTRARELQDYVYSNKEDFIRLMKLYSTIDYLVIDDFGNEYKNEYVRDSITLTLLNERARNGLITIFTSEFNFDELTNMYSLNNAGKARGHQLNSLLKTYAVAEVDISTAAIY